MIRERTMRVLRAVPADKLEWRHTDGVFSTGYLARHLAAVERYTFAENVMVRPSRYHGAEDLERKGVSPQGVPVTAWKLLPAMVEHEVHHRGEMYVYLALLGVPRPPLYGVTEQELLSYSA